MLPLRIVIDVGSDVPGWPFTNPPVADAFMAKILFDLGATFLAPVFFDRGIVVIGHKWFLGKHTWGNTAVRLKPDTTYDVHQISKERSIATRPRLVTSRKVEA
jgi:hypothetical protein